MNILEITLKLFLAIALGGIVGLEREARQKPAGLRTNVLICLGSAMMMILSQILLQGKEASAGDQTRIAAGVITGIGFIGAGTILQARGIVHGLTTASTLWAVACLGLVVGAGYYLIGIIFTGLILLTLILFQKVEAIYLRKSLYHYHLKIKNEPETLVRLKRLASELGLKIEDLTQKKEKDFSFISFHFSSTEEKERQFNKAVAQLAEVLEIKID